MLTKEQILSITDDAKKELPIPEWNGSVYIRGMTIEDAEYCQSLDDDADAMQKMVVRFVSDDQGNPLFSEEDIPALKKKSIQAFKRIIKEIREFNSLEGVEKNSESTPE